MSRLLLESKSEQYVDLHFKAKEGRTWKIQNWNSGDIFGVFHSDTSSFVAYLDSPGNLNISAKGIFGGEVWTPGLRLAAYGDGAGISLYGGEGDAHTPQYGLMFAETANFGCYGQVTGDWATYFTMDGNDDRGWIFRLGSNNVASIGSNGIFDAKAYVGRCNGVTNSIFSQNAHYTHYNTDALEGHWFNTDVRVQGRVYCGPNYGDMCMSVNNTLLQGPIGATLSINSSGQAVIDTWINNLNVRHQIGTHATWCPVCWCYLSNEVYVRGLTEFVIASEGGAYTPHSVKIKVDLSWSGNDPEIEVSGSSAMVDGVRITKSSEYIFIECHFTGAYDPIYLYHLPGAVKEHNCNNYWNWYSGTLYQSGNFSASVVKEHWHGTGFSTTGSLYATGGNAVLTSANYSNYAMPTAHWAWSGQSGQPAWVWGGNNYQDYRVWNPANFSVNYANTSNYSNSSGWTNASNTYEAGNSITQDTTADTLFAAQGSGVSCAFMASGPTNNFADVLYWSGYQKWGGTQLAADYNAQARPLLAVRKYNQTYSNWGHWGYIHTSSFQQNFGNSLPTSGMVYGDIYYVY